MSNKCNWRLEAISNAAVNRKKTSFILMAGQNDVGKRKDSHIKIPSALCSREHCSIFLEGDKVTVKDTVSKHNLEQFFIWIFHCMALLNSRITLFFSHEMVHTSHSLEILAQNTTLI